jgi:hypothetical protein
MEVMQHGCAGLKIRPRTLHQNAGTRNALIRGFLAVCPSECGCTTMQQNEADPALDPAPDFAKARPVPACRDVVAVAGRPIPVKDKPTHLLRTRATVVVDLRIHHPPALR